MFDLEQRRLCNIKIACFKQWTHIAEKERQQQGADMGTIDVRIGHDDDFMVACFFQIEFLANPCSKRCNDVADFSVGKNPVKTGFFYVEDFPTKRQDRLEMAITP